MASLWRATVWFAHGYGKFGRSGYEQQAKHWDPNALNIDLSGKVFVVTGANSGIGYATAHALASRKGKVHMLCRNKERGTDAQAKIIQETGNQDVVLHVVDVSSLAQVKQFASDFVAGGEKLDCLVNNAGVMPSKRTVTAEGFETTFATNLLSNYLITKLLVPALQRAGSSRVIFVSSGGMLTQKYDTSDMQFEKGSFDGTTAYAQTKRGQVMLCDKFAEVYADSGITFNSMHPGWADTPGVETQMPKFHDQMKHSLRSPNQGADTVIWMAVSPEAGRHNGEFFFDRQVAAKNLSLCFTEPSQSDIDTLWHTCEKYSEHA